MRANQVVARATRIEWMIDGVSLKCGDGFMAYTAQQAQPSAPQNDLRSDSDIGSFADHAVM